MAKDHGTGHIIQTLIANLVIAIAKGIAAVMTGSGAMLAETLHTLADCVNQLLLLLGVKRSRRPPSESHPLGYGPVLYFWSFMVALLLFAGGGLFSIYEGVHKFGEPEEVHNPLVGIGILAFSLLIEGWALSSNIRDLNRRRGSVPFVRNLKETKDSDLVVIFGENLAAVLGLVFALAALLVAWKTNDGRYDAIGSLAIGVVLIGVALFLAVEIQSLLIGERADPAIDAAAHAAAKEDARITDILNLITVQRGPGEVVVSIKICVKPELSAPDVCRLINEFEARLRSRTPEARWIFVEPGLKTGSADVRA